eukprot:GHVQ01027680.1.p1 GENE.GHVQ01027680.1~~GHVQ01027680.1.p1  ORF type:complete len:105 (-),score=10.75 GHVQ01027680.1:562-876(-)
MIVYRYYKSASLTLHYMGCLLSLLPYIYIRSVRRRVLRKYNTHLQAQLQSRTHTQYTLAYMHTDMHTHAQTHTFAYGHTDRHTCVYSHERSLPTRQHTHHTRLE